MKYDTYQQIVDVLASISGLSLEELEPYADLISVQISALEEPAEAQALRRFIMNTAARLNYQIALTKGGDSVSTFTAGDVSITEKSDVVERAKSFMEATVRANGDITATDGNGFDFRTV